MTDSKTVTYLDSGVRVVVRQTFTSVDVDITESNLQRFLVTDVSVNAALRNTAVS